VPATLHRKEEIYTGPFLEAAPDLLVTMDNYTTEVMAELGGDSLFTPNSDRNGTHNLDGLFIARGPGIMPGETVDAHLLDVAPTAVHLAGLPIPTETDGEVLLRLFEPGAPPRQRSIQQQPGRITELEETQGQQLTAAEQAQVEQQLRDLGYLS